VDLVEEEIETISFAENLEVSGDGGATWYPLELTPLQEL